MIKRFKEWANYARKIPYTKKTLMLVLQSQAREITELKQENKKLKSRTRDLSGIVENLTGETFCEVCNAPVRNSITRGEYQWV